MTKVSAHEAALRRILKRTPPKIRAGRHDRISFRHRLAANMADTLDIAKDIKPLALAPRSGQQGGDVSIAAGRESHLAFVASREQNPVVV